jgi:hypothetical protein
VVVVGTVALSCCMDWPGVEPVQPVRGDQSIGVVGRYGSLAGGTV